MHEGLCPSELAEDIINVDWPFCEISEWSEVKWVSEWRIQEGVHTPISGYAWTQDSCSGLTNLLTPGTSSSLAIMCSVWYKRQIALKLCGCQSSSRDPYQIAAVGNSLDEGLATCNQPHQVNNRDTERNHPPSSYIFRGYLLHLHKWETGSLPVTSNFTKPT